jgi:hypothetical protein
MATASKLAADDDEGIHVASGSDRGEDDVHGVRAVLPSYVARGNFCYAAEVRRYSDPEM